MSMPDPILPPELTIDPPMSEPELDTLLGWIDYNASEADVEPASFAADVVMGASDTGDDPRVPEGARWRIRSTDEAEWAMRHLAQAQANIDAIEEQRKAYVERITTWSENALRSPRRDVAFFGGHLSAFALERRAQNERNATLSLPSGTVKTARSKPKAVIVDEKAVVGWAATHLTSTAYDEAVNSKPLVSKLTPLVRLAERETGRTVIELSCGCGLVVTDAEALDGVVCPVNPEHGAADVARSGPEAELVVVDANGEEVPGFGVQPEHVTAKATPSR